MQTTCWPGRPARARPSQVAAAGLTSSWASTMFGTPASRHTRSWLIVATVTPQAPASSWRAMIDGAIEVLACGASEMSLAAQKALIAATLCWNPACLRTSWGNSTAPSSRHSPGR